MTEGVKQLIPPLAIFFAAFGLLVGVAFAGLTAWSIVFGYIFG